MQESGFWQHLNINVWILQYIIRKWVVRMQSDISHSLLTLRRIKN